LILKADDYQVENWATAAGAKPPLVVWDEKTSQEFL
jgi:hypothetical protein